MIKRMFDLCFLILLSPFILLASLIVAGLVYGLLGSPVIFRQERVGKDLKIFTLYKFRSMSNECSEQGIELEDSLRLGRFGKILRASSLDEIPGVINVLRGEMSLVGPRPLLPEYIKHYSPQQNVRHSVLPGITGWAQVNGRNSISWEEKFELDTWYVRNRTLWVDLKIIFLSIGVVLVRNGITSGSHATSEKFRGNE